MHTYGQVEGRETGAQVAFFWQIIIFMAFIRTSFLSNYAQVSDTPYYVLENSKYKQKLDPIHIFVVEILTLQPAEAFT